MAYYIHCTHGQTTNPNERTVVITDVSNKVRSIKVPVANLRPEEDEFGYLRHTGRTIEKPDYYGALIKDVNRKAHYLRVSKSRISYKPY